MECGVKGAEQYDDYSYDQCCLYSGEDGAEQPVQPSKHDELDAGLDYLSEQVEEADDQGYHENEHEYI